MWPKRNRISVLIAGTGAQGRAALRALISKASTPADLRVAADAAATMRNYRAAHQQQIDERNHFIAKVFFKARPFRLALRFLLFMKIESVACRNLCNYRTTNQQLTRRSASTPSSFSRGDLLASS